MTPRTFGSLWRNAFLVVVGLFAAFPFVWMVLTSLKRPAEIFAPGLHILPNVVTFENYQTVLSAGSVPTLLLNGVLVCTLILVGQLLLAVPAGYAFARLEFRGRDVLFVLVLAGLVLPSYITAIPNFLLLTGWGLKNSYSALVLPFLPTAFGTFLFRQFFRQIPSEIFEAARLDGCGRFALMYHVILPLGRPAIGAFAIFSIVAHWNDLFWPLIITDRPSHFTPPVGIVFFADSEGGTGWGRVMAAATLVITPLVIVFLLLRKQFAESLSMAARG